MQKRDPITYVNRYGDVHAIGDKGSLVIRLMIIMDLQDVPVKGNGRFGNLKGILCQLTFLLL